MVGNEHQHSLFPCYRFCIAVSFQKESNEFFLGTLLHMKVHQKSKFNWDAILMYAKIT